MRLTNFLIGDNPFNLRIAAIFRLDAHKQRFRTWLFRPKIEHGTIVLTQRSIFILPTRQGIAMALLLILMLLGDINYNLSLGYVLTFLLAMMAVLSILHAYKNLAQLEIRAGRAGAVFCGKTARFNFHISSDRPRYQLCLRDENDNKSCYDIPAARDHQIVLARPATRRGWLQPGRLTLYSEFPLGLFRAWAYLHFDTRCLVYPKPLNHATLPTSQTPDGTGTSTIPGDEDFAGLRNYVAGDALPHIAWKAYARSHVLRVKQFSSPSGEEIWLDPDSAPERDLEGKLARATRWILEAECRGLRYGLTLPGCKLPAGNGLAHRDECLRRLALFGLSEP